MPCSRSAGGVRAVEERALLGEAQPRARRRRRANSIVVSETEISRWSCIEVVGEDDALAGHDVEEERVVAHRRAGAARGASVRSKTLADAEVERELRRPRRPRPQRTRGAWSRGPRAPRKTRAGGRRVGPLDVKGCGARQDPVGSVWSPPGSRPGGRAALSRRARGSLASKARAVRSAAGSIRHVRTRPTSRRRRARSCGSTARCWTTAGSVMAERLGELGDRRGPAGQAPRQARSVGSPRASKTRSSIASASDGHDATVANT